MPAFMQAGGIIAFLLLYFTTDVAADLTLQYDIKRPAQPLMRYHLQLASSRIKFTGSHQPAQEILLNLQSGALVQVDHRQQRFFSTNIQTLDHYVALFQQNKPLFLGLISASLGQFDARQQTQIQLMLGWLQTSPSTRTTPLWRDHGRSKEILGIPCRVFELRLNEPLRLEVCMAGWDELQFPRQDVERLLQLQELTRNYARQLNFPADSAARLIRDLDNLPGLPVEVLQRDRTGRVISQLVLRRVSLVNLPDTVFRISPNYQAASLPSFQ